MWWKKRQRHGGDRWLALVTASYAALSVILLPWFQYHLQNDSFAYLSLAATHTHNPYWGPMLPFLIRLFTTVGVPTLFAIRLPSILASIGLLVTLGLSKKYIPVKTSTWNTVLLTLAIFLLTKTLDIATPDILLVFFFALIIRFSAEKTVRGSILAGLFAGLGYLTKSVALPFFLLFSALFFFWRLTIEPTKRKDALIQLGISVIICTLLSVPWIITISGQAGHLTIGESATIIHATMNPLQDHQIPMNVRGLLPPPSGIALSIWDDPTALEYTDWSPISSLSNMVMQTKIIIINASRMIDVVFKEFWLAWAIAGAALVFAIGKQKDALANWSRLTVGIWAILLAMYLPIVTDDRYVWIGITSLLVTGGLALEHTMQKLNLGTRQTTVALAVFCIAFTAYPAWRTVNAWNDGRTIALDAKAATAVLRLQGVRTASDNWKVGLAFSSFAQAQYYGRPKNPNDNAATETELAAHGIDIYIVTGRLPELSGYKEILTDASSVHLFRRIER